MNTDPRMMQSINDLPFSLVSGGYNGFQFLIPDTDSIKNVYQKGEMEFPFWSKIWPSAKALSEWITEEPKLIGGLNILEMGAGIGLPSFVSSLHARNVIVTDYQPYAVDLINLNISINAIQNMTAAQMDWRWDPLPSAEIYLLSDVNYELNTIDMLKKRVEEIISSGSRICLSTPQRITAVAFVEFIQPFILSSHVRIVDETNISLYHLGKPR